MEGIRAQFNAKLGFLPVWAWALLAVLAVLAWMYLTKSGFFASQAPATPGPQDTSGDAGLGQSAMPLGLGGLAGGGSAAPNASANPVPGYYDPSMGGFVGTGSSDAGYGGTNPIIDLSGHGILGGDPFLGSSGGGGYTSGGGGQVGSITGVGPSLLGGQVGSITGFASSLVPQVGSTVIPTGGGGQTVAP